MLLISWYDKKYQVNGYDYLWVEVYYVDVEDRKLEFGCWWVFDIWFFVFDKYGWLIVLLVNCFLDIWSWFKVGGVSIWDFEKRIVDKNWKLVFDGWLLDDSCLKVEC